MVPNVLVTEGLVGKVSDFGMSRIAKGLGGGGGGAGGGTDDDDGRGGGGSILWAAPEILLGGRGSCEGDMFAFAVTFWELLHWSEPFAGMHLLKVATMVARGARPEILPAVERLLPGVRPLLEAAWHESPAQRPSFIEALAMLEEMEERLMEEEAGEEAY